MSRREDIDNAIWSDPDFEALSPNAKLVYLWSFTNSRCGMAGLYKLALGHASLEVGVDVDEIRRALDELAETRFAFYEANAIWVRSRVRHLRTRTPQIARSIAKDLESFPDAHPLRVRFLEEYGAVQWLVDELAVLAPEGGWEGSSVVSERRRLEVLERDGYRCLACGATARLHIDHIKPVSRGGRNDLSNLQTLCITCNARKGVSETSYLSNRGSEGSRSAPLGEIQRSSTEGPKTFKGKGKGSGKGKGTLGGKTEKGLRWRAWAAEHVNDLPAEFVAVTAEALSSAGRDIDGDVVRRAVLARYPSLRASA